MNRSTKLFNTMLSVGFIVVCLIIVGVALQQTYYVTRAQDDEPCPGSLPPRLIVGEQGQVGPGSANNVRTTPSTSGERVFRMEAGTVFTVLDGPVCAEDFTWWQVDVDGAQGWTVEGDGTDYFLIPLEATDAQPTPGVTPAADTDCEMEPRLVVGREGRLTSNTPSRLRDEASTSGTQVGQIQPLDIFDILEGPVCADGINWWRVQIGNTSGWTAEGVDGDYLLEMIELVPTATPAFLRLPGATDVSWSSDGETIAVSTEDGIYLYDANDLNAAPRHLYEGIRVTMLVFHPIEPNIMAIAYQEDGNGVNDNDLRHISLIDSDSGETVIDLAQDGYGDRYYDLTFSADGTLLMFTYHGEITVYKVETGEVDYSVLPFNYIPAQDFSASTFHGFDVATMSADASWVGGTYARPNDTSLVFFGEYGADDLMVIESEVQIPERTTAFAIAPDGSRGIVGDERGNLRGWSLPDFEYSSFIRGERSSTSNRINDIIFHPTEPLIVTAESDPLAVVRVFDATTLSQIRAQVLEIDNLSSVAHDLAFSPDGAFLAVIVDDTVQILETENYTLVAQLVVERY